jgi:predicted dehydrogenase
LEEPNLADLCRVLAHGKVHILCTKPCASTRQRITTCKP